MNTLVSMHKRVKKENIHGRRYTEMEKDLITYNYLTAGKGHSEFLKGNAEMMCLRTLKRHIEKYSKDTMSGELDIDGLKTYLVQNNYPLVVFLCEDATRVTGTIEYNCKNDSITGLVAPFDSNGMPARGLFQASTPHKMIDDLSNFTIANYAYVQMALPLAADAAPYVFYFTSSDNKFSSTDVLQRWNYSERMLGAAGITVIGHASDGDSRLMKAMQIRSCLGTRTTFASWFIVDSSRPICVQDMHHTVNKLRNRILKRDLDIGM